MRIGTNYLLFKKPKENCKSTQYAIEERLARSRNYPCPIESVHARSGQA